jgi:hypothetical protein
MGWGMAAVEYCEVGCPFYRAGEAGRWPAGSDGGGGVFQLVAGYGGEAKRRRRRLREGKGGGDREASGPVQRGWPEGMGGHVGVRSRGGGGCSCSGKKEAKAAFGSLRFLKRGT